MGKASAAGALWRLAAAADLREEIAETGALYTLVQCLAPAGSAVRRAYAAGAVMYFAEDSPQRRARIVQSGALPALAGLLQDGCMLGRENASGALRALAVDPSTRDNIAKAGTVPHLVRLMRDGRSSIAAANAAGAAELMTEDRLEWRKTITGIRDQFCQEGAIAALTKLMHDGSEKGKACAAGALKNLGTWGGSTELAQAENVQPLVEMLREGNAEGKANAAAVIAGLCENARMRELVAVSGAIPLLMELLKSGSPEAQAGAAGALKNLAVVSSLREEILGCG